MGWGRGCLCGPLHPSSVCTHIPQSPGGERLDSSQAVLCQHAQLHTCKFTAQEPPARMDLTQKWLGCLPGGQRLGDQAAIPTKTHLPGPTTWNVSENHLVAEMWLTPVLRPIGLDPHPWECRAFSACVRVAVSMYLYVCRSSKAT